MHLGGANFALCVCNFCLVGGLEHVFFHIEYWEQSSQLTKIFQRGRAQPPSSLYISFQLREASPELAGYDPDMKFYGGEDARGFRTAGIGEVFFGETLVSSNMAGSHGP